MRDLPSEVSLGPNDGLPKPCVVNLDHITLVELEALGGIITVLDGDVMGRVCSAVNAALGCDRP